MNLKYTGRGDEGERGRCYISGVLRGFIFHASSDLFRASVINWNKF